MKMREVVKYAPVLEDRDRQEFPSLTLMADTQGEAIEQGRRQVVHKFTGRLATVTWETPLGLPSLD